jgi:hypothetical protein
MEIITKVFIGVFIIIVLFIVLLFFNKTNNYIEFYPECDFKGVATIIKDKEFMFQNNVNVNSIKSVGYHILLFDDIDYKGNEITISGKDEKNSVICVAYPIKSFIINRYSTNKETNKKSFDLKFYSGCNFQGANVDQGTFVNGKVNNITDDGVILIPKDIYIKSIQNIGYKVFLFDDINYKGELKIIDGDYENACLEKPVKSIMITNI